MSFKVLESVLRPLSYWYTQDNIEEVAINRSKQIWLRLRGKRAYPWVMYKDEKLTKEYLTDLCRRMYGRIVLHGRFSAQTGI